MVAGLLALPACVSRGRFDQAVADAERAQKELALARGGAESAAAASEAEKSELRRGIAEAQAEAARLSQEISDLKAESVKSAASLDEATAMNQGLRAELERLGKDVDKLLSSKGVLSRSLDEARARLEELRRAQAAAEARAALFREVALKLKRMVDSGRLKIVLRSGRMVLMLSTDVLFDSGKTQIKAEGKEALAEIAGVLRTLPDRAFQVSGHTDNEPIRVSGFASNWELSSERALEVVGFLIQSGMSPNALSAAGYGEFDPVKPNDTRENMAANRRIEIVLQPKIDEFVAVPEGR